MAAMAAQFVIVGSIAWDEIVELEGPLRAGSHNNGYPRGGRIGGGAANTAMGLARGGDRVSVVSAVGADSAGAALVARLQELGVDCSWVFREAEATTRSLVMLDAEGERTVVNLARAVVPLPDELDRMEAAWLYVRSADPALTGVLAKRVARGLRVLAHVPPTQTGCRPAQVLVASASDVDAAFLSDPYAAGRCIAGERLEWMVVTYGPDGARAFGPDTVLSEPAPKVTVVDSTGAGDVFAAGLLHGLARSGDMEQALATGVAWGSASVTYAGTVPPRGFPLADK